MYHDHYGLKNRPFSISPDPRFLWLGEKHAEALATLNYGIMENKGFLLLTGGIGTGKTVLINSLVKQINAEVTLATIPDPRLELIDFYNILANEFKMDRRFESKGDFLIHFKRFLIGQSDQRKKVLLIVDEAQRLNHGLMDEIRVLSNIEFSHRKLINIFFVGQSEFKDMLLEQRNRPLRQRITYNYHLDSLTEQETASYMEHRLNVAGAAGKIFSAEAIREIHIFSQGIPRLINIISDHGLVTGYSLGTTMIDGEIIKECGKELQISGDLATLPSEQPPTIEYAPLVEPRGTLKYLEQLKLSKKPSNLQKTIKYLQKPEPSKQRSIIKVAGIIAIIILFGMTASFFLSPRSESSANLVKPNNENITSEDAVENLPVRNVNLKAVTDDTQTDKPAAEKNKQVKTIAEIDVPKELPDTKIEEFKTRTEFKSEIAEVDLWAKENSEGGKLIRNEEKKLAVKEVDNSANPLYARKSLMFSEHKFLIYFKADSTELDSQAFKSLNKIVELVSQNSDSETVIAGYSDSYGNYRLNRKLSQYRSDIVKSYLVAKGVANSSISAVGFGSESPIGDNKTQEGRKKNRRVEIRVKKRSNGNLGNTTAPVQ